RVRGLGSRLKPGDVPDDWNTAAVIVIVLLRVGAALILIRVQYVSEAQRVPELVNDAGVIEAGDDPFPVQMNVRRNSALSQRSPHFVPWRHVAAFASAFRPFARALERNLDDGWLRRGDLRCR